MITLRFMAGQLAAPATAWWLLGEVEELVEELRKGDLRGVREEWGDVAFVALILVYQLFPFLGGVPFLPGLGLWSCHKFLARFAVWEEICAHHDVVFEVDSLSGGSNYRKLHKVEQVLRYHGVKGVDVDWVRLHVGGFES